LSIQQINLDTVNFPKPKFDQHLEYLLKEYKEKYQAKSVRISRPVIYSDEDSRYWLKVEFLNPDLDTTTFQKFGKDVALSALEHLTNDQDFDRIEIVVLQKNGFILTFSTRQNAFFYRDSL